jgi:para-nitrobenzyl esterase
MGGVNAPDALVETHSGVLRGEHADGLLVYRGIPYARPPVGPLRWRPTRPVAPWSGVRDARSFGMDAMQRNRPATSRAPGIAEDCLTLNVWAPSGSAGKLPVMVWFYGGSFMHGSASDLRTDGAIYARDGVVFVSVNSRVGIFGWLAHPELIAESGHGAAGNYGLFDQIMALRWIRENIAAFGGDPERITAFGVSSGGASIAALITSPLAKGVFDRAILESAGSFRPLATLDQAAAAGAALGSLEDLRALSAADVLAIEPKLVPAVRGLTTPRVLRPICDGWVISHDERDAYESGAFNPVAVIVGSNADEGARLTATWPIDDLGGYDAIVESNFPRRSADARRLYPAPADGDARRAVADMFGDTQFQLGARELARAIGKARKPAYRYVFTKRRAGIDDGPHHGGEVPYVFGHLDQPPQGNLGPPDDRDRALARAIRASWIHFAATGDAGPIDDMDWPIADQGFIDLGETTAAGISWREEQLDFLNAYARL